MQKIQLWSVERAEGKLSATAVESVDNTETEQDLEDLLVASPDLLMEGLTLIGRQVATAGGPLDLLGIDADGRLVVFELKRGTLTRDAVAQALDYASDLAALDDGSFGALIERHSGRLGVERIEDFADWYRQEHPGPTEFLRDRPRMVLVGLGVDERARRIVNFLAESRVDIQLLTFHAFREGSHLFLARQVESESPQVPDPVATATKESNLRTLHAAAKSHTREATWSERTPEGRWRPYSYDEIVGRDKVSLDLFWLRDESLEDSADLPEPHVLARQTADDLRSALGQMEEILADLEERAERSSDKTLGLSRHVSQNPLSTILPLEQLWMTLVLTPHTCGLGSRRSSVTPICLSASAWTPTRNPTSCLRFQFADATLPTLCFETALRQRHYPSRKSLRRTSRIPAPPCPVTLGRSSRTSTKECSSNILPRYSVPPNGD